MYCPSCGETIADDVRYCRECGDEVNSPTVDASVDEAEEIERSTKVEHQCQDCGEMLRSGEPPCKHCGGMDIKTRPIEPDTASASSAGSETVEVEYQDTSRSFIWPAGPFYPVQRICGWGLLLSFVVSFLLGLFLGADGVRLAAVIGALIVPWLVLGFVGSWFIDTILVYLKE